MAQKGSSRLHGQCSSTPPPDPADFERIVEGLRKARLPEP